MHTGTIRRQVILVRDSKQDCHKMNKFAMTQQDESTAYDQQHGPLYILAKIVFLENLHYRLDSDRKAGENVPQVESNLVTKQKYASYPRRYSRPLITSSISHRTRKTGIS